MRGSWAAGMARTAVLPAGLRHDSDAVFRLAGDAVLCEIRQDAAACVGRGFRLSAGAGLCGQNQRGGRADCGDDLFRAGCAGKPEA